MPALKARAELKAPRCRQVKRIMAQPFGGLNIGGCANKKVTSDAREKVVAVLLAPTAGARYLER